MALIYTPGLTRLQADRLRANLLQLTGLSEAAAAGVYIDADRLAGRAMLSHHAADHMHARCIVADLVQEHRQDGTLVAYVADWRTVSDSDGPSSRRRSRVRRSGARRNTTGSANSVAGRCGATCARS